jgi:hypothetical protein
MRPDSSAGGQTVIRNVGASLVAGLAGLLGFGVPLLLLTALMSDRWQRWALIPWGIGALYFLLRGFRLRVVLAPGRAEVRNYLKTRSFVSADLAALIATRSSYPNPIEIPGCAGFLPKGSNKALPANVTMSWGWRFGGPSSQARRFHGLLEEWGRKNGVRVDLRPLDLQRARRKRSSHLDDER